MPLTIPPELKPITPYIRRAEELDKDQFTPDAKEVAYFCRYYAMEKSLKLRGGGANPGVDNFLMSLMNELEQIKQTLAPGTKERGKIMCESFALSVFEKADEEDRAGLANKETARVFYNASSFFDILEQFGDIDEEFANKNKYSKWKATEIMKALKEGRTPEPGGYGESTTQTPITPTQQPPQQPQLPQLPQITNVSTPNDMGLSFPSVVPVHHPADVVSINSIPQAPPVYSFPASPIYPIPQQPFPTQPLQPQYQQQPQYSQPPPQPQNYQNPSPSGIPYKKPPTLSVDERTKDALELCAFAMTAMKHKEIELAKDRLREALKRLG